MTENKRFMLDDAGELIDKETAQFIEYGEKVCDLLNELHEENEQLKQRNNFLKKQLDRVCSENEIIGDKLKKIGRIL